MEPKENQGMTGSTAEFGETAKSLSRNPLGIIALFIVLIYGFASLVVVFGRDLQPLERLPLVWFLVVFPVLVLAVFAWLVSEHHAKLYAPSDYADDASFLQATQRQTEIAVALGAASARWCEVNEEPGALMEDARSTALTLSRAVTPKTLSEAKGKRILWVDDQPDNVIYERQALERLGMTFIFASSTEDAVRVLNSESVDLVITDMSRGHDKRAGYTLLSQVRKGFAGIPVIIYSSSRAPEYVAEAKHLGAYGATNRPDELFEWVVKALKISPDKK